MFDFDFQAQKQKRLAERLRALGSGMMQNAAPKQTETVSGMAVPQSPFEGFSRLINSVGGAYMMKESDDVKDMLTRALVKQRRKQYGLDPESTVSRHYDKIGISQDEREAMYYNPALQNAIMREHASTDAQKNARASTPEGQNPFTPLDYEREKSKIGFENDMVRDIAKQYHEARMQGRKHDHDYDFHNHKAETDARFDLTHQIVTGADGKKRNVPASRFDVLRGAGASLPASNGLSPDNPLLTPQERGRLPTREEFDQTVNVIDGGSGQGGGLYENIESAADKAQREAELNFKNSRRLAAHQRLEKEYESEVKAAQNILRELENVKGYLNKGINAGAYSDIYQSYDKYGPETFGADPKMAKRTEEFDAALSRISPEGLAKFGGSDTEKELALVKEGFGGDRSKTLAALQGIIDSVTAGYERTLSDYKLRRAAVERGEYEPQIIEEKPVTEPVIVEGWSIRRKN